MATTISQIMSRDVVCAREDQTVSELSALMLRGHFSAIPVVDARGAPCGIVTKTDLIEVLVRPELATGNTADVMMPLAIVLGENASVAQCASMMATEDFHHVMVVSSDGRLVGVVSSQDIVRWLVANERAGGMS